MLASILLIPSVLCLAYDPAASQSLINAVGQGDLAGVRAALGEGADPNFRLPTGETPLHISAIACDNEIIELLLKQGARVNVQTEGGDMMSMSPLHWFVNMNPCDLAAVTLLLDAGADLSIQNSKGATALDMVKEIPGRAAIAESLRTHWRTHLRTHWRTHLRTHASLTNQPGAETHKEL